MPNRLPSKMKSTPEIITRDPATPSGTRKGSAVPLIMTKHAGFTLVELLVVVIIIGLVSIMMSPIYNDLITAQSKAYEEKHHLNNQLIGAALMGYAANSTQYGRLPAPYTGAGYTNTIYNPADGTAPGLALTQALIQTGINPGEINGDNTTANKVRVYQLVQGIQQSVPLYFQSGPLVTLTYDYGAIYLTACPKSTAACNPNAVTSVPGTTASALTLANHPTWTTTDTDGRPYFISSMPIQKQMLATTTQRLDKVRDALLSYLRTKQQTAAGGDTTNWYPNQAGLSAAGSLTGQNPGLNQQCRDGWYNLSDAAINVLPAVGLSAAEYGKTAWGGAVEYCRDYDPIPTAANTPPHYSAIRINANVTTGAAPSATPGNNIVLTF